MLLKRCIPPTAAPLKYVNLLYGFIGLFYEGNRIKRLESEIKDYFSSDHVFLLSSGKAALAVILKGLTTIDDRVEVVIPAYTCYSLPAVILRAGLEIKLCDINPTTLDYNYEKLEKVVSTKTLCVISSNLFGMTGDIVRLRKITKSNNSFLVEDVAQAMGCSYDGKMLGSFGDAAFFSLGRGKNVTCGSGGIIITSSKEIAKAINSNYTKLSAKTGLDDLLELIKSIVMTVFINPWLYCVPSSLSFLELGKTFFQPDFAINRFTGVRSWLMKDWQSRLESANRIRERNSRCITNATSGISYLRIPYLCKTREEAEKICSESKNNGLGVVGMYPAAICHIPEIRYLFDANDYEDAISVASRLVTVPSHQLLNHRDIDLLKTFIAKHDMQLLKSSI